MHLHAAFAALLLNSGGLGTLPHLHKLHATAPSVDGRFGSSVALDASHLIVAAGAPLLGGPQSTVHVFDGVTLQELHQLVPPVQVAGDAFARSLAATNGVVAVGASHDSTTAFRCGAVHLFDANSGAHLHKLEVSGVPDLFLGNKVALDGSFVVAAGTDEVFLFDVGTGALLGALVEPPTPLLNTGFGSDVGIDAGVCGVGTPLSISGLKPGRVHLYDAATRHHLRTIDAPEGSANVSFGTNIAMRNGLLLVGAPSPAPGAAYVYRVHDGKLLAKLTLPDGQPQTPQTRFGDSVALTSDRAIISASLMVLSPHSSGSVYSYRLSDFAPTFELEASDLLAGGYPGVMFPIAAYDDTVVTGFQFDREHGQSSGAVYVHQIPTRPAPGVTTCLDDALSPLCACGSPAAQDEEGCLNSRGVGAKLSASGSIDVNAADLRLHVRQARANAPGVFLQGLSQAAAPFRDGLLCLGPPSERLEIITLDDNGCGCSSVDVAAVGQVSSGATRYYQFWYRDPSTGACNSGSNLSNGVQITWL